MQTSLLQILYTPQLVLSLLTATAYSRGSGHVSNAAAIHAISWVAQFLGHGLAEKRAPALLDNLVGGMLLFSTSPGHSMTLPTCITAVVLAPFFVHLEILFSLGYRPAMHRRIKNEIGKEITRIRKAQGEKRRQKAKSP